jgi:phage-related protein
MEFKAKFKVVYSDEVINFLNTLDIKSRDKIVYNIEKSRYTLDKELFKKLDDTDIWEFRTLFNGIQYRLLVFWDTENETLVITTHGFIKKTKKTPPKEIKRAEEIRKMYFNSKK